MKTSLHFWATLLFASAITHAHAQNLDDLFPYAHYTLIQTPNDSLGYQAPMELNNTVYEGADGVYFNGLHAFDPGGSYARTPGMDALYDPEFAVQVEFKIEDLDGEFRGVLVLGQSYRYLGLLLKLDSFVLVVNNHENTFIHDILPEEDVWYKMTLLYDTVSHNIQLFLDGMQLADFNEKIIRPAGDDVIANFHAGGGYPLKGNWRHLRVFGSQDISALKDELYAQQRLKLFPNPAVNELHFECESLPATQWRITGMNGESLKKGIIMEQGNRVTLEGLAEGVYYFQVLDDENKMVCSKRFVKQ